MPEALNLLRLKKNDLCNWGFIISSLYLRRFKKKHHIEILIPDANMANGCACVFYNFR